MKSQNILKRILALLIVLVLCMGISPIGALAAGQTTAMQFSYSGVNYTMLAGSTGSGDGVSWSCDADGNFSMEFSESGTLSISKGKTKDCTVVVVGGGAGGTSAYGSNNNGNGGNGGGAGLKIIQSITVPVSQSITVKVGAGGVGGTGTEANWQPTWDKHIGRAGGDSQFSTVIAAGGRPDAGGIGGSHVSSGSAGADRDGGGGASIDTWFETDCGNFRPGNTSCFVCGANDGYFDYNIGGWTPLYQNARDPGEKYGGTATNGGGAGGRPQNDHNCRGSRTGLNAQAGTGGGGGGGAFAMRLYGIGRHDASPTGSANPRVFTGNGGNGGSGKVTLTGKVDLVVNITLTKTSANPDMTNGNSCYSLAGAQYGIYTDAACTNLVEIITTGEDGIAKSGDLEPLDYYYVREISPSQGYLMDSRTYTLNTNGGGDVALTVKEQPGNDPVGISVTKITDDPAATLPSLEGTQFTVQFYGGQYSSTSELPDSPLRTWVVETKARKSAGGISYVARLNDDYKVSGDEFYCSDDGFVIVPIGTLTIQETKPADGYTTIGGFVSDTAGNTLAAADGIVLLNVLSSEEISSGGALRYGNEYTKTDKPVYGGIKVQKLDAETGEAVPQGGASFADIPFEIVSLNETEITVDGTVYAKDNVVYSGKSDENGYFATSTDLLPAGHYRVDEEVAPEGYQLAGQTSVEFDIVDDGMLVDLTSMDNGIWDKPKRADFSLIKENGDTKKPMADVRFSIISNTTGERYEFYTDESGRFSSVGSDIHFGASSEGGALVYDSYTIEELPCDANRGFALCEPFTFDAHTNTTAIEIIGVKNYAITIETNASFIDGASDKTQLAFGVVTVKDTVDYTNLTKGLNYKLITTLWDKTAGELLKDADGNVITAETEFKAKRAVGSTEARICFNADGLAGRELVVFEELYPVGRQRASDVVPELLAEHKDVNDERQTVRFLSPEISTSAKDADTGEHISLMADTVTIVDTVAYTDLAPGRKYTVTGVLMDKTCGKPLLDENGEEITAETEFIAHSKDGAVDVTFVFNGSFEVARKLVAFEELLYEGTPIAVHKNIDDEDQSIWMPQISTSARVPLTNSQLAPGAGELIIKDEVSYTGLIPGLEYAVSGQVLDPDTGDVLGGAITVFTPESEDGSIANEFKVYSEKYAGKRIVVYESVLLNGKPVAEHNDPDDAEQSLYIPQIITKATGVESGSNWVPAREGVHIKDTVLLDNLVPDMEYTVKGEVVLMSNPDKVLATAEGRIAAENSSEELELEFELDASSLQGESVVVLESLYHNDIIVAAHKDVNDTEQTVLVPDLHTEATVNGKHVATAASKVTLTDVVSYVNLSPDKEYRLEGTLMDKLTGEPLRDATGSAISTITTFTPSAKDGKAAVSFIFDASALDGKEIVVFEKLYIEDDIQPIAAHEDINDEGQTVKFINGPITGDDSQTALWLSLLGISVSGIGAVIFFAHKKRREKFLPLRTHKH